MSASVHVISLLRTSFLRLDDDRLEEVVLVSENTVCNEDGLDGIANSNDGFCLVKMKL